MSSKSRLSGVTPNADTAGWHTCGPVADPDKCVGCFDQLHYCQVDAMDNVVTPDNTPSMWLNPRIARMTKAEILTVTSDGKFTMKFPDVLHAAKFADHISGCVTYVFMQANHPMVEFDSPVIVRVTL